MQKSIYIADDEINILNLIKSFLIKDGFEVKTFNNGKDLLEEFYLNPCDLVILDVMMPGINGLSVCSLLRTISSVPIIILSAKDSDLDKVTGINIGCDDYLTKPFSPIELLARIKCIFRRIELDKADIPTKNIIHFSDIIINKAQVSAKINDLDINLTKNEFSLMIYLIENKNRAISRDELLRKVWDFRGVEIDSRATDDTVKRLRKKLLEYNSKIYIKTIRGFGFRIFKDNSDDK
ncbi:response regulator transcription factor [Clostridium tarantellae]|uniref:Stage 0 sporulation protein A homolog n=1 Tax=Clostridium tarantellae TaxID=39493 RepID=A0A6I1MKP4_9CLOT|nr:response regulator transcription factor [Clostridium tarantellae]MPQ43293.1 response regulator [Clostridium tarantellae]